MTDHKPPPRDGYRAMSWPAEYRAEADKPPRLVGHFARFGVFNEIDSVKEGRFMERIDPGAFTRTFKNNGDRIRVLFQHGQDPHIGDKPIAKITQLRSDSTGPYYEAELLDGIDPLILDGLRKNQYGVSYRFQVESDPSGQDWNETPGRSPANPLGLPERTILQAKVFEFGPVTFPADHGADVAVRSLTDQMSTDPVAPSDEPAALPHPVDEARDEPEPPPVAVIAASDPPNGGSSDSRSVPVNEDKSIVSIEDKRARVDELNTSLSRMAESIPGALPEEE
jgi:HK97 family phage prohead protease